MSKRISEQTRILLDEAYDYCDQNDMSTELMLQYLQDFAQVDFDTVMQYLKE